MCPRTRDLTEVGELLQRVWRATTVRFFFSERKNMKHFSKDSMGALTLPHRVSQMLTACRIYNLIRKPNGAIIWEQIVLQSGRRFHRSSLLFPGSWEDNGVDKRRESTPEAVRSSEHCGETVILLHCFHTKGHLWRDISLLQIVSCPTPHWPCSGTLRNVSQLGSNDCLMSSYPFSFSRTSWSS